MEIIRDSSGRGIGIKVGGETIMASEFRLVSSYIDRGGGYASHKSGFGDPIIKSSYSEGSYTRCSVYKNWAEENLITFVSNSSIFTKNYFSLHWKVAVAFVKALYELLEKNILDKSLYVPKRVGRGISFQINQFSCFWSPRSVPRSGNPSVHSFGVAFDLNASVRENDYPYYKRENDFPWLGQDPRVVRIFDRNGFYWGGSWSKADGMHFEASEQLMRNPLASDKKDAIVKIEDILKKNNGALKRYLDLYKVGGEVALYAPAGWIRDEAGSPVYYASAEPTKNITYKPVDRSLEVSSPVVRQTQGKLFIFG